MGHWEKLGLVYGPAGEEDWLHSHAQVPVADHLSGDRFRIYFAARNRDDVSSIGYVVIDLKDPCTIIERSARPALAPGPIGTFDQFGVFPSCIVNVGSRKYLYYIGWIRGYEQPLFYAAIGLAISDDGGQTFQRHSPAPILSTGVHDPCLVTAPHVLVEADLWRLTYVSGLRWYRDGSNALRSVYHIKYAESRDGIDWKREGRVAIDFKDDKETNIARPWVLRDGDRYRMWFSYVVPTLHRYRIGYAESADYEKWTRMDGKAGIDVSADGFDSDMIAYANVFEHGGRRYMLYNGNQFGKAGFGMAVWMGA